MRVGRGIAFSGETHIMSDVYSAVVADVEVNIKTGKVVVKHIVRARRTPV